MGAKGDGITDDTEAFQTALNKLKLINNVATRFGGTVFVPSGKYVIKGNLTIPKGVTLRGEWEKPVKGEPIEGTILMAYNGRDDAAGTPLITLGPGCRVLRDMAIWYPETNCRQYCSVSGFYKNGTKWDFRKQFLQCQKRYLGEQLFRNRNFR